MVESFNFCHSNMEILYWTSTIVNLEQSPVTSLGIVQLKVNNYRIVLNLKNRNNYDLNIYCYICKTKSEKSLDKFKSILE